MSLLWHSKRGNGNAGQAHLMGLKGHGIGPCGKIPSLEQARMEREYVLLPETRGSNNPTTIPASRPPSSSSATSIKETILPVRQKWEAYGVSLVGDGWTNIRSTSLEGVLASCRGMPLYIESTECGARQKTAPILCEMWSKAVEYVGPKNVVQFVSNGEATNKAAAENDPGSVRDAGDEDNEEEDEEEQLEAQDCEDNDEEATPEIVVDHDVEL
ncbi:hypothetical protein L7F22_006941 [Adiantum nelumboides]|nr:hypothetical protein [Adiantum nelumboides]